jgi:hypothetical protein
MLAAEELEASYERRFAIEIERFRRLQDQVTDYKLATKEKMEATREAHGTSQAMSRHVGRGRGGGGGD